MQIVCSFLEIPVIPFIFLLFREERLQKENKREITEKIEKLNGAIQDNQSKMEKVEMDAKSYQSTGANYSEQIKDKTRIIAKYKGEISNYRFFLTINYFHIFEPVNLFVCFLFLFF